MKYSTEIFFFNGQQPYICQLELCNIEYQNRPEVVIPAIAIDLAIIEHIFYIRIEHHAWYRGPEFQILFNRSERFRILEIRGQDIPDEITFR